MFPRLNVALLLAILVSCVVIRQPVASLAQANDCGGARPAVATLSDTGAAAVSREPLRQQVVDLDSWPPPPSLAANLRSPGIETHIYVVTAELLGSTLQPNGDYDMVLAQPGDERWTILAVLPDPARCAMAAESPEASDIQAARSAVASTIGLNTSKPIAPTIVRVTGAGYFNPSNGAPGEAQNALELSPVINFTLVGPAALAAFPVVAHNDKPPTTASSSLPQTNPADAAAPSTPQQSTEAQSAVAQAPIGAQPAAEPAILTATTPTQAATAVSQQQISSLLASNAPSPSELPSVFGGAVLAAAGPGTGPTSNAYDVDYLLIDKASQQPAASLTYLIFPTVDDAQSALMSLQQSISASGASPEPLSGYGPGSFCAVAPSGAGGSPCAIGAGAVLILSQAGDVPTASAAAQAGFAHLAALAAVPN
jgi:hypothetical protein